MKTERSTRIPTGRSMAIRAIVAQLCRGGGELQCLATNGGRVTVAVTSGKRGCAPGLLAAP